MQGYSCLFTGYNMSPIRRHQLMLIKWKDDQGTTQRFYLIDKVSMKWRTLGLLLDLSYSTLEALAEEHRSPDDCCQAILSNWLENPPPQYPNTWKGLIELLEDSQLVEVVHELKTALEKANLTL